MCSCGILRSVYWLGEAVSDFLTLEDEKDRLFRNVGYYQSSVHKIPEELRSRVNLGGSLKSCKLRALIWPRCVQCIAACEC